MPDLHPVPEIDRSALLAHGIETLDEPVTFTDHPPCDLVPVLSFEKRGYGEIRFLLCREFFINFDTPIYSIYGIYKETGFGGRDIIPQVVNFYDATVACVSVPGKERDSHDNLTQRIASGINRFIADGSYAHFMRSYNA